MYYSKPFNYNYAQCVGYDTCDKYIWESGEGIAITNKTSKQGSHKPHLNKVSPTPTLDFGCSPNNFICDIFLDYLVSSRTQ